MNTWFDAQLDQKILDGIYATFTSQINHMLERGRFGGKACAVSGQNRRCTKNIAATLLGTIHI